MINYSIFGIQGLEISQYNIAEPVHAMHELYLGSDDQCKRNLVKLSHNMVK